jgi:anaerobic selenocysteine-containing dehydrogenase
VSLLKEVGGLVGSKIDRRTFIKLGLAATALGLASKGLKAKAAILREVEEAKTWWHGETGRVRGYAELLRVPDPGPIVETGTTMTLSTPEGLKEYRLHWFRNWLDWSEPEGTTWPKDVRRKYFIAPGGVCGGCEVSCHYIVWIDKETNLVRKVMANPFAKNNWGLCARGQGSALAAAVPDRITFILSKIDPKTGRRVGDRGDDNWVRITYDESLDIAAEYWSRGLYGWFVKKDPAESKTLYWMEGRPLQIGWATHGGWLKPWEQQHSFMSHTNLCSAGARLGNASWTDMDRNSPDYFNAKLIVLHGKGILGDTGHYLMSHGPRAAIARFKGAKVVSVREKYFHTDLLADYWVAAWPGTEAVLWLAVANVLVNELKAANWDFVKRWWNWYWLVMDRDGVIKFLLERGYIKTPPPEDIYERLPDGRWAVREEKWDKAFEWFKTFLSEYLSNFTPEYAAWVTRLNARTLPPGKPTPDEIRKGAELIRAVAREIAAAGTAISFHQWRGNSQTYGGWMAQRAAFLAVVALTGAYGTIGGTGQARWHEENLAFHGWKGSIATVFKKKSLTPPPIWNEYTLSPEEQAFGHYDPTNPNVFKWYDEEWKGYWRRFGFAIPDRMHVHFSRVVNPLATYQAGVLWARLLSDTDKIELVIHATPFWNETAFFADIILPEGFFHERHEGQPAAPGIYAPDRWVSVRWPSYYLYLTRAKRWSPKNPHRTALEAHQEVGLGDVVSYQEWSLEVLWRAIFKAVEKARRDGVPLSELVEDRTIDYMGQKVRVFSLADRLEFLIDSNKGKAYADRIGVKVEDLARTLIERIYRGEITYEQWKDDLRKQLLMTIHDWYNWASYKGATPELPKEAKRLDLEPVEYLEMFQFWVEETGIYKEKTYEKPVALEAVAKIDPVTRIAYDKDGRVIGVQEYPGGRVYAGQGVWSRKLEFISLPMREQEFMELSIPIFPREPDLDRAIAGDIEAARRLVRDKMHLVIPLQDFWAPIPGLTTGIDPSKGELLFVANSRFLFAGENTRPQYNWFSFELWPALYLWVNPEDAKKMGLKTGDVVRVRVLIQALKDLEVSSFVTKVWVTPRVREGVCIMLHGNYRWKPSWWDYGKLKVDEKSIAPFSVIFSKYEFSVDGKRLDQAIKDKSFHREWGKIVGRIVEHVRPATDAEIEGHYMTSLYKARRAHFWDQAKFVWWKETGTTYDFILPQTNDPVSWTNIWHFKVRIEKAKPEEYGQVEFDFEAARNAFEYFFKLLTHGSRGELARRIYSVWRQRWGLDLEFPRILGVVKGELVGKTFGEVGFRRAFFFGGGIGGKPARDAYKWPIKDLRELP